MEAALVAARALEWFRLGSEQSERQWTDILGVLRVNRGRVDLKTMEESAKELAVSDLLAKALNEAEKSGAE